MWVLIGSCQDMTIRYTNDSPWNEWTNENLATFSSKELAEEYVEKSRLKSPKDRKLPFRQTSLLSNSQYAEIEEYYPEYLEHDPSL